MSKKKNMTEGVKYDKHKIRWDLVPFDAVNEIAKVLTFGAAKYDARNWEKGMDWSRVFGAIQRHLTRWFHGQDVDKETGLTHLAHAGCCIFFLLAWEMRKVGTDDRPKLDPKLLEEMDSTDFMNSIMAQLHQELSEAESELEEKDFWENNKIQPN